MGEAELRAAAAPGGQATGRSAGLERPKDRTTGRGWRGRRRRRKALAEIPLSASGLRFLRWFSFARVQKVLAWKLLRWGPNCHFMASIVPLSGAVLLRSLQCFVHRGRPHFPSPPSRPAGFRGRVGPASCTIRPTFILRTSYFPTVPWCHWPTW